MPHRYTKLAAFYFLHFSSLGIYLPYWSLYLRDLGFSASAIGMLLAVALVNHLFAPYLWGWISDRMHAATLVIRLAATMAPLCFALVLLGHSFYWLAFALFIFSFFWHALLPQIEVLTMRSLKHQSRYYSSIRLWGSIGFIVCVTGVAPAINHYGTGIIPWLIIAVLIMLWGVTLGIDYHPQRRTPAGNIMTYLRRPEILSLFALCFLMKLSHGPYYTFFSIYLREHGYSETLIGQIWACGVAAEVVIFLLMHKILPKTGAPILLFVSLTAAAARWLITAHFAGSMGALLLAQSLHAVTFGVYHAAAIHLVNFWFRGNAQGRGQALYSAVSFGAGGSLGSYLSGQLWDSTSSSEVFHLAAIVALVAIPFAVPIYRSVHHAKATAARN